MMLRVLLPLVLCCAALSGCDRPTVSTATADAPSASAQPGVVSVAKESAKSSATLTGQPQPKLPTIKLWLGAQEIVAEQATTPRQIQTGMMFRKEMAEQEGMLFVFPQPFRASFWMRNTILPLTCAYIDAEGAILEIRDMKPLDESPIEAKSDRVQYVLEMNQGWFERNKVQVGMLVRTERGSLRETYFGRP